MLVSARVAYDSTQRHKRRHLEIPPLAMKRQARVLKCHALKSTLGHLTSRYPMVIVFISKAGNLL